MIARTKTGVPALELPVTGQLSGGKIGRHFLAAVAFLLGLLIVGAAAPGARSGDGDGFRAMMNDAVSRMHEDMHLPFTGDADRDFARMMIPHHQGAIDMAIVEIRYGKDGRLRRLAQEIIVTQQQEIAVMHLALGDSLPPSSPAPTQLPPDSEVHREH